MKITPDEALQALDEARAEDKGNDAPSSIDDLMSFSVSKEYIDMLGEEDWLFLNLIIKNQITTIISKSGGGKTTINYDYVAPWILRHHEGITIFYLDCDSPASDHKRMKFKAEENGLRFHWINPIANGETAEASMKILRDSAQRKERLDNKVFFFDTLKKFLNLMDKRSVKPFFELMRQLVSMGATIVLLGHANKYRDGGGNLVFEGVGDVQNDSDALILFERMSTVGGIDVTTVVDPDKGAKVRGIYEPISFNIDRDRNVTQHAKPVPVPDWSNKSKKLKLTEEEIEDLIRDYLKGMHGHVKQRDLVAAIKQTPGASYHQILNVLSACAVHEKDATQSGQIYFSAGLNNQKAYSIVDGG